NRKGRCSAASRLQHPMASRFAGCGHQGAQRQLPPLKPHPAMSIKSFGERIADVLIEDGLLLASQLEEASQLQKKQGGRLLKILTDNKFVTEQDMVISMGRCLDTPPINLSK